MVINPKLRPSVHVAARFQGRQHDVTRRHMLRAACLGQRLNPDPELSPEPQPTAHVAAGLQGRRRVDVLTSISTSSVLAVPRNATQRPNPSTSHTPNCSGELRPSEFTAPLQLQRQGL